MQKVYSRIESIAGNVITVSAENVRYGELALVSSPHGQSLAEVIKLQDRTVSLQVYAGGRGISTGDEVRFLGHTMQVSFSDDLLGRIFDGSGRPRDNGPPLEENLIEIGGPSVNPAKRIIPRNMVRTGIPMIDVFNSLVESQKLPIFSVSGEPYNQLLARIAMQAEVDMIILGGMGLKYDDYLFFRDTLEEGGALSRSILFVHTASDPVVEMPPGPGSLPGGGRAVRAQGKKGSGAPDGHDKLRRFPQGDLHHHGAGAVQPRLSGRSLQPARIPVREGGRLRRRRIDHHSRRDDHARRRRHASGAGQHRLHHRRSVLPPQQPDRAVRVPVPAQADGQQGYPGGSPLPHGRT